MDYREIREVLNTYWQGESSLGEEKQIKDFFHEHPEILPQDIEPARELFVFFEKESLIAADTIPLPLTNQLRRKESMAGHGVYLLERYWEYAAIFLFLLMSLLLFNPKNKTEKLQVAVIKDTYQNPQQAFDAAQKALEMLAANLNKGKDEMQKLAVFNQAEELVKNEK